MQHHKTDFSLSKVYLRDAKMIQYQKNLLIDFKRKTI